MNPYKRAALSVSVLLAASLTACGGPDSQKGSSTALDGNNNIQISGVIIPQETVGVAIDPVEVAAARARQPHQYDEAEPLSLFDFNTNLNPSSNR